MVVLARRDNSYSCHVYLGCVAAFLGNFCPSFLQKNNKLLAVVVVLLLLHLDCHICKGHLKCEGWPPKSYLLAMQLSRSSFGTTEKCEKDFLFNMTLPWDLRRFSKASKTINYPSAYKASRRTNPKLLKTEECLK